MRGRSSVSTLLIRDFRGAPVSSSITAGIKTSTRQKHSNSSSSGRKLCVYYMPNYFQRIRKQGDTSIG